MTGRDLIIHIMENNLEDEPILVGNRLFGTLTSGEAADQLCIGVSSLRLMYKRGLLDGFEIGDWLYILPNKKFRNMLDWARNNKGVSNV